MNYIQAIMVMSKGKKVRSKFESATNFYMTLVSGEIIDSDGENRTEDFLENSTKTLYVEYVPNQLTLTEEEVIELLKDYAKILKEVTEGHPNTRLVGFENTYYDQLEALGVL